jgi:pimeloyl-ACP methyl ester carboxylesterase
VHRDDSEDHWRNVRCPVCIVSGGLAAEYWRTQMPMEWDGAFAEGELEARIALFPDVAHVHFPDAGHMIHYDDPERLAQVAADFLEKRL